MNTLMSLIKSTMKKIPKLQELYKQILSDTDTASFKFDTIESDEELLNNIESYYTKLLPVFNKINQLFAKFNKYNLDLIFINNDGTLNTISNEIYKDWSYIRNRIGERYDIEYTGKLKKIQSNILSKNKNI